jgi:hypothetical protein
LAWCHRSLQSFLDGSLSRCFITLG